MKRLLKWTAVGLLGAGAAVGVLLGLAWWKTEQAQARVYAISDSPLPAAEGETELAYGDHLFHSRGCSDCHGDRGEGKVVMDAPPFRVVAPNITPAGTGAGYDHDRLGWAIRHGVRHDGRPLFFMPTPDYAELSDADTAALAAYVAALPPVEHDPGRSEIRPLGRVLYLLGQVSLFEAEHVDHAPRVRAAPVAAATTEYGAYLAASCSGCHGSDFAGQRVPGTPPDFPPASNMTVLVGQGWREADFVRLMREGKRPDGSQMHPLMPVGAFKQMTDLELQALWLYFSGLPAKT